MAVTIPSLAELTALDNDDVLLVRDDSEATFEPVKRMKLGTLATWLLSGGEGGLQYIDGALASSATSIDFTSFDETKYASYALFMSNLIPATDGAALWLRTSSNAGSSYDNSVNDYDYAYSSVNENGGQGSAGDGAASAIIMAGNVGSDTSEDGVSGLVLIYGPHLARRTFATYSVAFESNQGTFAAISGAGWRAANTPIDAVQIRFSSGFIESGEAHLYGIRNS